MLIIVTKILDKQYSNIFMILLLIIRFCNYLFVNIYFEVYTYV